LDQSQDAAEASADAAAQEVRLELELAP
jgi:hypothetical protein